MTGLNRVIFLLLLATLPLWGQANVAPSRYYVVFLRPDPGRKPLAKEDGERIMAAHIANIHKIADDGVLVSAGPFDDMLQTISGIFIFTVDSLETAQTIANKDPTVMEHRNAVDVHSWEGPPGIGIEYSRLHKLDPKTPENMQVHPFCMVYRGAAWDQPAGRRDGILRKHEHYIETLKADNKLSAAGAIDQPDDLFALVVFRPISLEEAQRLLDDDPAVKAGVLRAEYHHWWSSDHVLPW